MEDVTLEKLTQEAALKRKFRDIEAREKYLFRKLNDQEADLKDIKSILGDMCRESISEERDRRDSFLFTNLSKPEQMEEVIAGEEAINDAFNVLRTGAENFRGTDFPHVLNKEAQEIALKGLLLRSGWRLMKMCDDTGSIGRDFKKGNFSLKIGNKVNKDTKEVSKYLVITCWQNKVEENEFGIVNPMSEIKMITSINFEELPKTFQAMYHSFMCEGILGIHPSKGVDFNFKLRERD